MSSLPVAIITGGASGIGLATARSLVHRGWKVAILDLDAVSGRKTAAENRDRIAFFPTDVSAYKDQASAFAQAHNKWGRVDFVFANAGILETMNFVQPENEAAHGAPPQPDTRVFDINLNGVVWSSYLALHYFRKNESKSGKLVMTSSTAGIYAIQETPLYAAAKHGVIGLMRSLGTRMAAEKESITVNALVPGVVATSILSDAVVNSVPERFRTPASVVVKAIENILDDSTINAQAIECSGSDICARPPPPFVNEAAEFTAGGKYRDFLQGDALSKLGMQQGEGSEQR